MSEKAFFRVRVKESCPYSAVMVKNLGKVTKTWQLRKGLASDYSEYPNLDVQPMVKEGNDFVPASDDSSESEEGGTGGSSSNRPAPEPQDDKTVAEPEDETPLFQNFADMSVEQLKAYLSAKGQPSGKLRGMAKADLIALAESVAENV